MASGHCRSLLRRAGVAFEGVLIMQEQVETGTVAIRDADTGLAISLDLKKFRAYASSKGIGDITTQVAADNMTSATRWALERLMSSEARTLFMLVSSFGLVFSLARIKGLPESARDFVATEIENDIAFVGAKTASFANNIMGLDDND